VTEQQKYQVLEQFPRFEVRLYPAHVVAEVAVSGSFESAGSQGFRPLVNYIGGRNATHVKVAGTMPSSQAEVVSTRIAMTAPVIQHAADESGQYIVSFVMPESYTLESLPVPTDASVTLRAIPAHKAAVLRFTGRWSADSYDEKAAMLRTMLPEQGFVLDGPMRFARFDPPWTPWFMRRNEVIAPIAD
jgi:hypothetical protein